MPSLSTYNAFRRASLAAGAWDAERDAARLVLAASDLGGLVAGTATKDDSRSWR
jgi:hypothetical protein